MPATKAKPLTPASEAWGLLQELLGSIKQRFMAVAQQCDLSPPQMMALRNLDPERPLPMNELAAALHIDNSSVTGIVDRLEDRGLVERRNATHDRRLKMLAVTANGAELRAQLSELLREAPEPIASLSHKDQMALRDILRRAVDQT